MSDTFDPSTCASPAECVEALADLKIKSSHRLAARVFALGQRNIQFSLAVLEEAQEAGPMQTQLLRREWLELAEPRLDSIRPLLDPDLCEVIEKAGVFQVVSPDEAMISKSIVDSKAPRSLLPAVLGTTNAATLRPNLLWDRHRLEKSSLTLLDGEVEDELLADFRYLFRALVTQGIDPTTLLIRAFSRNKMSLSLEAARLIREQMDPKLGSLLEQLFSSSLNEVKRALQTLASEPYETVRGRFLTTLIGNVWQRPESRPLILKNLRAVSHRLAQDREAEQQLLEQLLAGLGELVPSQRAELTEDIVEWIAHSPGLTPLLFDHLEQTTDPDRLAFLAQLLALLTLTPQQAEAVEEILVTLFYEHGQISGMLERLRAPLRRLGGPTLLMLLQDPRRSELSQTAKTWLLQMADDEVLQDHEVSGALEGFAVDEVVRGSRTGVLALIRTQRLHTPGILEGLRKQDAATSRRVVQFLLSEAERLEPPDDEPVLKLLSELGQAPHPTCNTHMDSNPSAIRLTYDRLCQEASIASGAAARTLWRLGRLININPAHAYDFIDVEAILAAPIFHRRALPHVWNGLSWLGIWKGCSLAQRERIFQMLLDAPADPAGMAIEGLARLHSGSEVELRLRIEECLLEWLSLEETPRRPPQGGTLESESDKPVDTKKLRSALEAWMLLVQEPQPPELSDRLVTSLCRLLIRRATLATLDVALKSALQGDPEMDGVRRRPAWDKADRDQALKVLGGLALSPNLDERLFSLLVTRLFSFLEEWLVHIKRGENLYENRTTPLWDVVHELLEKKSVPRVTDQAVSLCRMVLEVHGAAPGRLVLEDREDALRFLCCAIRMDLGAGRVDLPRQILLLLALLCQNAADTTEPPVAIYFLRKLKESPLREDLAAILAPLDLA